MSRAAQLTASASRPVCPCRDGWSRRGRRTSSRRGWRAHSRRPLFPLGGFLGTVGGFVESHDRTDPIGDLHFAQIGLDAERLEEFAGFDQRLLRLRVAFLSHQRGRERGPGALDLIRPADNARACGDEVAVVSDCWTMNTPQWTMRATLCANHSLRRAYELPGPRVVAGCAEEAVHLLLHVGFDGGRCAWPGGRGGAKRARCGGEPRDRGRLAPSRTEWFKTAGWR